VLATGEGVNIAWLICRPIVASLAMALLSPLRQATYLQRAKTGRHPSIRV
jgi:hypothetical protein